MAFNDIYQVVHKYTWGMRGGFGSQIACRNVFYYRQDVGAPGEGALLLRNAFGAYFPLFQAFTTNNIRYDGTDFVCLGNPTDFYNHIGGTLGTRGEASEPAPSFLAVQLVSNRNGPGTRAARKRYPVLHESDLVGNNVLPALITAASFLAIRDFYVSTISNGGAQFTPVVAKHPININTRPDTSYDLVGAQWSGVVSTQNTRKS